MGVAIPKSLLQRADEVIEYHVGNGMVAAFNITYHEPPTPNPAFNRTPVRSFLFRTVGAAGRSTRTVMPPIPRFSEIYQYRQATTELATSGQPREEQLADIAAAGYEVVINLALHDDRRYSLRDEAASIRGLGLEYVHIPVQFDAPTEADLAKFFEAMDTHKGRRVWLHCAANLRVTAFLGLYRRLREGWPEDRAFELMDDVWEPNPVWADFIRAQLESAHDD